jgi:hypothetical protein
MPRSFPIGIVILSAAFISTKPLVIIDKEHRNKYIFKKTILTF